MSRAETRILNAEQKRGFYEDDMNEHDRGLHLQRSGSGRGHVSQKSKDKSPVSYTSTDRSSVDGSSKRPLAGLIFMCNDKVRKSCFRYGVFGMPLAKKQIVDQVKPGTKLFLFEFEARELWGIYEATTGTGVDIEPDAYRGSEVPFPAQVKFRVYKRCEPLAERDFRGAIKENYFKPSKFKFELTGDQVLKLMRLFSPREIVSKGAGDNGSSQPSPMANINYYNGKLQALEGIDGFVNERGETWKKGMVETTAGSRYFHRQVKHEDLKIVPISAMDHWTGKGDQYLVDAVENVLEGHSTVGNSSQIRAGGSLYSDVRVKQPASDAQVARVGLNSSRAELPDSFLKGSLRDDGHLLDPRYKGKHLLYAGGLSNDTERKDMIDSVKVSHVRQLEPTVVAPETNKKEGYLEEEYRLYKLKMKYLNDRAFQRELLYVDQYDRGEGLVYTGLQGDTKKKGQLVDSMKDLHARQMDDSNNLTRAIKKEVYLDEDKYPYGQKRNHLNDRFLQRDLAFSQDSSQRLVDNFDSYDELQAKTVRKKQWATQEDLDPPSRRGLVYVPLPSQSSRHALASTRDGNYEEEVHNATASHKYSSLYSLEDDDVTPTSTRYSANPRNLTVTIKNDKARLANLHYAGSTLMHRKEKADKGFSEKSERILPNSLENEVQRSIMRISGKPLRSVRVASSKVANYPKLLENASTRSGDDNVKRKPSVWSRLSGPAKNSFEKDSALPNKDVHESFDSWNYLAKKRKWPLSRSDQDGSGSEIEMETAGLEDSLGNTIEHSPEEDFVIDFKRRKCRLRGSGTVVHQDHGTYVPDGVFQLERAAKGRINLVDDCGIQKGRRRIIRPQLVSNNPINRQLKQSKCVERTESQISEKTSQELSYEKMSHLTGRLKSGSPVSQTEGVAHSYNEDHKLDGLVDLNTLGEGHTAMQM